MGLFFRWIAKTLMIGTFWVFILSIQVQGRPLFFLAQENIIQNDIVIAMDAQLERWWERLADSASRTFAEYTESDEELPTY